MSADSPEVTPPEVDAPISSNRVLLDRYELEYVLGRGGNGMVFGAFDRTLQREVAVKVFLDDTPPSRIHHEALSLATLSHPNIIALHDLGDDEGRTFLVMDIVHGETLWSHMCKTTDWRELVSLFMQAGAGLAEAHRSGIAHGDVKASNILVGRDGRVHVSDFGHARVLLEPPEPNAPRVGGTRGYMAPERLSGGLVDPSSDQFSFCASIWEALYRCRPWSSNTAEIVGAVEPAKAFARRMIPAEFERVLRRGLAVDPRARFESMDTLVDALAQVLALRERRRVRRRLIAIGIASSVSTAALLELLARST